MKICYNLIDNYFRGGIAMDTAVYVLLGVITALLVVLIILLIVRTNNSRQEERLTEIKVQNETIARGVSGEFERNRRENADFQHRVNSELTKNFVRTTDTISKLKDSNYENLIRLNDSISTSLNQIKDTNFAQNEKQTKEISEAITRMQESNEKKLDQMRNTVDEKLNETLGTRLDSSFKAVSQQLENVYKSLGEMKELSTGVTSNVSSLNRVLTNVKARGTWAEVQLEGILDQTIPNMYVKNFAAVEGSQKRVEFAVKFPSNDGTEVYLPIDSKFPMEDYVRLCTAADDADADAVKAARKALEDRVLNEAKEITKYINVPVTTPFAILYLATEGLYAEIASSRSGIAERIQSNYSIMIAGPTTITALLNSLSMGFKAIAINEKANEVRQLLGVTRAQYEKFGAMLDKAGKKIEEAGKSLDDARKRNELIRKKLKNIDEPDSAQAELLGMESDGFEQ